jgi:hypothetical protein
MDLLRSTVPTAQKEYRSWQQERSEAKDLAQGVTVLCPRSPEISGCVGMGNAW